MLPKALLTAGLLGGAALTTLGAGSAQAAWNPVPGGFQCDFLSPDSPGVDPGCTGEAVVIGDKKLSLLGWLSIPGTAQLTYDLETDPTPYHIDLDFGGTGAGKDFDGGILSYSLEIINGPLQFDTAELAWNSGVPSPTVTKEIFSDPFSTKICELNANPSQCNISGQKIWVRDTWGATVGGLDNVTNDFSQVPAPLPLLGAGAAFGSIRKLRKFSSQLKTFSLA